MIGMDGERGSGNSVVSVRIDNDNDTLYNFVGITYNK